MIELEKQLQINFTTGETKEVVVQGNISITNYFRSLEILNRAAPLYGCVYLATEDALNLLEQLTEKPPTRL